VCPNGTQKSIADELFLAGADVIVGAHPHILQGTSLSNNKLIAYSLGNFSWYANYALSGALLTVKIDDGKVTGYSMTPTIWDRYGLPMRATGSRKSQIEASIKTANACGGLKRNT
jgi:poly-gamma-glutamate synthesis protein (capsule biosynthesis protein)